MLPDVCAQILSCIANSIGWVSPAPDSVLLCCCGFRNVRRADRSIHLDCSGLTGLLCNVLSQLLDPVSLVLRLLQQVLFPFVQSRLLEALLSGEESGCDKPFQLQGIAEETQMKFCMFAGKLPQCRCDVVA